MHRKKAKLHPDPQSIISITPSVHNSPSTFFQPCPSLSFPTQTNRKAERSFTKKPSEKQQCTDGLLRKIKTNWTQRRITSKFKSFIPQSVLPTDDTIQEQWMSKCEDNDQDIPNNKSLSSRSSKYMFKRFSNIFSYTELVAWIFHLFFFWFVSIELIVSQTNKENFLLATEIWVCAKILYVLIDLNTQKIHLNLLIKNRVAILKRYLSKGAYIDASSFFLSLLANILTPGVVRQLTLVGLALLLVYKIRKRFLSVEECFEGRIGPGWFKLMQCFVFLAYFAHTCALVLYSASFIHPEDSWLDRIPFTQRNWFCDYVYSLYWAVTIIVTVGFGDIGPKNKYEIGIVLLIEILGTSFFGYMINVIGMTLTDLQKQREAFESTLKTADKLCHCFGLDSSLSYRLRTYLKNNQRVDTMFSLADENKIMEKLSPALKKQVLKETNSQIIEKCIFFLTYFKFSFLSELSLRLTKRIIQPGEELPLSFSHPNMYIIDTGSIDIEVERNHRSRVISKKVHSISRKSNKEVSNNLYGYVFVITGHPTRLHAISTSFTFVYELAKQDFFDCIQPGSFNHQIICELKHRYLEHRLIDEIEVPQLADPTRHYRPHTIMLLLKCQKVYKQQSQFRVRRQMRTSCSRQRYRLLARYAYADRKPSHLTYLYDSGGPTWSSKKSKSMRTPTNQMMIEMETVMDGFESSLIHNEVMSVLSTFDAMKEYSNYMKSCNVSVVLKKYKEFAKAHREKEKLKERTPAARRVETYMIVTHES